MGSNLTAVKDFSRLDQFYIGQNIPAKLPNRQSLKYALTEVRNEIHLTILNRLVSTISRRVWSTSDGNTKYWFSHRIVIQLSFRCNSHKHHTDSCDPRRHILVSGVNNTNQLNFRVTNRLNIVLAIMVMETVHMIRRSVCYSIDEKAQMYLMPKI